MSLVKEVSEHLARAKGYFHRHDVARSLRALATAIKQLLDSPAIVGRDKQTVQMGILELHQLLGRTEEVQRLRPEGLPYERGKERQLLLDLLGILKLLDEEARREQETQTQTRKLRMDRLLLRAGRLLEEQKLQEALNCYEECASLHVDEDIVFTMIGRRLLDAGAAAQALPWLKRAVTTDAENVNAHAALAKTLELQGDLAEARLVLQQGLERLGPQADLLLPLAMLEEQAGDAAAAQAHYKATLTQAGSDHAMRRKAKTALARLGDTAQPTP